MRISQFRNIIRSKKVVSFDIFDTLIERKCLLPPDVFFLAARAFYGDFKRAACFCSARMRAERSARSASIGGEVTLDDIYNTIEWDKREADSLKDLELKTEITVCKPKRIGVRLLEEALNQSKQVVLISDMYLPSDFIECLLKSNRIEGYDQLFLSCLYGDGKSSGRLFDIALKTLDVKPVDIVHFGDSYKSDYKGAKKNGIEAHLISRKNVLMRLLFSKLNSYLSLRLRYGRQ